MGKRKFKSENLMAISAIVVAVAAIGVSVWQGLDNRRHNMLSVKPKLQIIFRADPNGDAEVIVTNNGLGPATVTNFDILLDGKLLDESSLSAVFKLTKIMGLDTLPFSFDPVFSTTIRAGDQSDILRFLKTDPTRMKSLIDTLISYMNRVDLSIDYESMYGESFSVNY